MVIVNFIAAIVGGVLFVLSTATRCCRSPRPMAWATAWQP